MATYAAVMVPGWFEGSAAVVERPWNHPSVWTHSIALRCTPLACVSWASGGCHEMRPNDQCNDALEHQGMEELPGSDGQLHAGDGDRDLKGFTP